MARYNRRLHIAGRKRKERSYGKDFDQSSATLLGNSADDKFIVDDDSEDEKFDPPVARLSSVGNWPDIQLPFDYVGYPDPDSASTFKTWPDDRKWDIPPRQPKTQVQNPFDDGFSDCSGGALKVEGGEEEEDFDDHDHDAYKEQRADGGSRAWLFLIGAFWVEALVWGYSFSYGVFEDYYSTHLPFSEDVSLVPIIGSTNSGLMYMLSPLHTFLMSKYPVTQRIYPFAGTALLSTALIASAFTQNTASLLATQGILYAIGGSMTNSAMVRGLDTWFVRRKGLACGIVFSGSGLAGVAVPYIAAASLRMFGFRATCCAWAVLILIVLGPFLWWQRPRRAERQTSTTVSWSFLRHPSFFVPFFCTVFQGMGFFLPIMYLPTYVDELLGGNTAVQSATLTAINGAAVVGCLTFGSFADRLHVDTGYLFTSALATFAVLCLWGFAASIPNLIVFAILYGLSAGSWSCSWASSIKQLKSRLRSRGVDVDGGVVFGLFPFARGFGSMVSGPFSDILIGHKSPPMENKKSLIFGAYGTDYSALVAYIGLTAALGGMTFVTRYLESENRRFAEIIQKNCGCTNAVS